MLFGVGLPVKAVSSASSQECGIYYAKKHDVFAHHPYLFRGRARCSVVTVAANGDRRRAASVLKY